MPRLEMTVKTNTQEGHVQPLVAKVSSAKIQNKLWILINT